MIKLSTRLRALREEHHLTQEQLAQAADVSYNTYRKYEMNSIKPKSENLEKLATFYNMSIGELLDIGTEFTFKYDREDIAALRKVMDTPMPTYLKIDSLSKILDRLYDQWEQALQLRQMSDVEIAHYKGRKVRKVLYDAEEQALVHRAEELRQVLAEEKYKRMLRRHDGMKCDIDAVSENNARAELSAGDDTHVDKIGVTAASDVCPSLDIAEEENLKSVDSNYFSYSNGLDIVFRHLKTVYGERGDLDYNLKRYWNSEIFHSACRVPKSINDIPEATLEILHALCDREYSFKSRSESLVEQFDKFAQEGRDTTEVLMELGGYFGICPGNVDWLDTMFPHFTDLFVSSNDEGAGLNQAVQDNANFIEVSSRLLVDLLRKNHIYEHDGRKVLSYGYVRNFFRGENAYFGTSRPGMFRGEIAKDDASLRATRLASALRIADFYIFIESLPFVKTWPNGTIYHAAIAQHYGLPTPYIDVTSDIKTALFFACTKWDKKQKCWRPLEESEYNERDSRNDVARLNGDSRYGILHIAPADVSAMAHLSKNNKGYTVVHPIGIQPFMRCHYQSGYIVKGNPYYNLYSDPAFNEVKFRHTKEICDWIYNEMDQGKKIYPYESLKGFEEKIDLIKKSNVFSKKAFDMQFDQWRTTAAEREDEFKNLTAHGYRIEEDFCVATPEEIASIDRAFWQSAAFRELDSIEVSVNPIFVI